MASAANSCLLPCKAFAAIAPPLCMISVWGWTEKRTFAEIVFTGFAKLLRCLPVMASAANSCLLPCKAFAAIAPPLCMILVWGWT